jgi:hypothetical protein
MTNFGIPIARQEAEGFEISQGHPRNPVRQWAR